MRYEVRLTKTGEIVGYYHSKSNKRPPAGTEFEVAKDITPGKKHEIKASVWYSLVPIGDGKSITVPTLLIERRDDLVTLLFYQALQQEKKH